MRSPSAVAAAIVLLGGVALAIVAGAVFNGGSSEILHLALAGSFFLIAWAVADFRTRVWIVWAARVAIAVLAAIFLLQGISDITHAEALAKIAYGIFGGPPEKALGYVFLVWCAAVLVTDSAGATRWLGTAALAVVLVMEAYRYWAAYFSSPPSEAVMLLYLPVFVWLLLEGAKPRAA